VRHVIQGNGPVWLHTLGEGNPKQKSRVLDQAIAEFVFNPFT